MTLCAVCFLRGLPSVASLWTNLSANTASILPLPFLLPCRVSLSARLRRGLVTLPYPTRALGWVESPGGMLFTAEDLRPRRDDFHAVPNTVAGTGVAGILQQGWGSFRGHLPRPQGDYRP